MAPDGAVSDAFGASVAADGDVIVVGSQHDDDQGQSSGSAYVFHRNQGGLGNWGQVRKLLPSTGGVDFSFGCSVAVSGDVIVVGAYGEGTGSTFRENTGAAYVFERNAGGADKWGQVKKLVGGNARPGDMFGFSVGVRTCQSCREGDVIVVGAAFDNATEDDSGSAYVFHRHAGGANKWGQVRKLLPTNSRAGDKFGSSVAVGDIGSGSVDTIVVGTPELVAGTNRTGSIHVFGKGVAGDWSGQAERVVASGLAAQDEFGTSVALGNGTIVVGARGDHGRTSPGAAYAFSKDASGNWNTLKLISSDGAGYDHFGWAVALAGDTIVVGAPFHDDAVQDAGSAYVFGTSGLTPSGKDIVVTPIDTGTRGSPVTIEFEEVLQGGNTNLTVTTGGSGPSKGFRLRNPRTYFEISTTAIWQGTAKVCIDHSGISFPGGRIEVFHRKEGDSNWGSPVPSYSGGPNIVCTEVDSF